MALTLAQADRVLAVRGELTESAAFDVLRAVAHHGACDDRDAARYSLIRILARRNELPAGLRGFFQGLVREHGLYPYLQNIEDLPLADRLAVEMHRPSPALSEDLVFHAQQAMVYQRLMDGENVVLSAPTSFGKSLIIDPVLAERPDFQNAAIVVPTIALMNECRRRLTRLRHKYKIITHGSQLPAERNLYVMTPERLLEVHNLPPIDFFVIDEFYKLDPKHCERAGPLNILFHQLLSTGAQFYLLGPNVTALEGELGSSLPATFLSTSFTTVVTDMDSVNVSDEQLPDALADICRRVGPETLIFCRSPKRTSEVANWLLDRGIGGGENLADAADWVGATYHSDWTVARALRRGIGIHHARLPRSLGHHMVRLFNEGRLPYLLVTSTLIEGVNTAARNVVVLDNKIASKKYDYFTFSNISGRSGRMNRHFIGRVVVFNPAPQKADLNVDIPILSQSPEKATDEILIQIPEDQLTLQSRRKLDPYYAQNLVTIDSLRRSKGTSLARQMDTARQLASSPRHWATALQWNGPYPTAAQVRQIAELLVTLTGTDAAAKTSRQLGARINMLRHHRGNLRALIHEETHKGVEPDRAVEDTLDFARNWAQFKIPSALTTSAILAAEVLGRSGYLPSDTSVFAGELENLFMPPFATVLEEYGLPTPTTLKLASLLALQQARNLDDVLSRLRNIRVPIGVLHPFEQEMLADAQKTL